MDALKKQRTTAKSSFTRISNWLDENINDITVFELKDRETHLHNYFNKYSEIQDQIDHLVLEGTGVDLEDRLCFENKYFALIACIRNRLHVLETSNSSPTSPISQSYVTHTPSVKLPQIAIPTFTGEFSKWVPFHQLFTSLIINNNSLTQIEKLIYLKSSLRGEPLSLIDSLQLINENFDIAITILEHRYNNDLSIINSHLNSILDTPVLVKSTTQSLREFITSIKQNVDSLKNLNAPVEHWDLILINILSRKLDFSTKREYQSSKNRKSLPTLKEFFEILEERCNVLSDLNSSTTTKEKQVKNYSTATHLSYNSPQTSPAHSSQNTPAHSSQYIPDIKCSYCNNTNHKIYKCNNFNALTHQEKTSFVRSKKMCFNCLGTRHTYNECTSRGCSICTKKHHTLLHINNAPQNTLQGQRPYHQISQGHAPNYPTNSNENTRNISRPQTHNSLQGNNPPHSQNSASQNIYQTRVPQNNSHHSTHSHPSQTSLSNPEIQLSPS